LLPSSEYLAITLLGALGVTNQKPVIFIVAVVRTSNLIK
jgi:hypothetical protein